MTIPWIYRCYRLKQKLLTEQMSDSECRDIAVKLGFNNGDLIEQPLHKSKLLAFLKKTEECINAKS